MDIEEARIPHRHAPGGHTTLTLTGFIIVNGQSMEEGHLKYLSDLVGKAMAHTGFYTENSQTVLRGEVHHTT